MKAVKAVLQQDKIPKGYPPSMLDVKTREKHIPESVDYNIKHFRDHGHNVIEQLKKMKQVSPERTHALARKSCKQVLKVYDEIEKYKKG